MFLEWEGKRVWTINTGPSHIQSKSIILTAKVGGDRKLTFGGAGRSDGLGMTFTNVKLFSHCNIKPVPTPKPSLVNSKL